MYLKVDSNRHWITCRLTGARNSKYGLLAAEWFADICSNRYCSDWKILFLSLRLLIPMRLHKEKSARQTFLVTAQPVEKLGRFSCGLTFTLLLVTSTLFAATPPRLNLALNKPASASSIENDDENAAKANDGDAGTFWCADDEPENGAEWWQVDLQKRQDLSGCQLIFPYDGKRYRYKVEGSADDKTWKMLGDQTQTNVRTRSQNLAFDQAAGIRYVRITITGFDEGCWASLSEVQIFGHQIAPKTKQ